MSKLKKEWDYYNSKGEWVKVDEDFVSGIANPNRIKELHYSFSGGDAVAVHYYGGNIVVYKNVHGSWGFPTRLV